MRFRLRRTGSGWRPPKIKLPASGNLLRIVLIVLCLEVGLPLARAMHSAPPFAARGTPGAEPTTRPAVPTTTPATIDLAALRAHDLRIEQELLARPMQKSATATATPRLSRRDEVRLELQLLEADAYVRPSPLSPDEALSQLRTLQHDRAAPQTLAAATTTPEAVESPVAAAAVAPAVAPQPAPVPLAPLEVDASLPGMPEYIVIGRTYQVDCITPARDIPTQRMRFVDYVRNVLPNEWVPAWPAASLEAGAIAAKQYAWYTMVVERKWRLQGYPFDIVDNTCDQYYRDASARPRTDAAIQGSWGTVLTRNGGLLQMYYRDTEARCGARADCMGQVESAADLGALLQYARHRGGLDRRRAALRVAAGAGRAARATAPGAYRYTGSASPCAGRAADRAAARARRAATGSAARSAASTDLDTRG
jgi:hypothetical protein